MIQYFFIRIQDADGSDDFHLESIRFSTSSESVVETQLNGLVSFVKKAIMILEI